MLDKLPSCYFFSCICTFIYIHTHIYITTCSLPLYPYLFGKRIESLFLIFSIKTSSAYVSDKCGSRFCHLVMMWLLDVWKLFNFLHKYKLFFIRGMTIFVLALLEISGNNYFKGEKCLTDNRHHVLFSFESCGFQGLWLCQCEAETLQWLKSLEDFVRSL